MCQRIWGEVDERWCKSGSATEPSPRASTKLRGKKPKACASPRVRWSQSLQNPAYSTAPSTGYDTEQGVSCGDSAC